MWLLKAEGGMYVPSVIRRLGKWWMWAVRSRGRQVQRPVELPKNQHPSMDVAREKFLVEPLEDIAAACNAAERG